MIARRVVTVLALVDLAVLGAGVVAAAVKDDSTKPASSPPVAVVAPSASEPSTPASSSSVAVLPSTPAAPSSRAAAPTGAAAPTSLLPSSAAASAPPAGTVTAVTGRPRPHPTSARPKASPSPAAHVGATPGTYAETTSGTIKVGASTMPADGSATLVVDRPQGRDQRQSTKSEQSTTEEIARFGTDGSVRLTYLHLANEAFDVSFHLPTPQLVLPAKPVRGMTYSWSAKSDDGKTTLSYTGTIKGTEDVTIGGRIVHCVIVHSSLKMTGGTNLTVDQTDDYAPAYRLIVREHQIANGRYAVFSYTADITTTLNSLTPQ